jgi:uncharacterized damage-inducible protein DinB
LVDAEWARFIAAVRSVPENRLLEPGVSGSWSVKDIAGHVATWDHLLLGILQGDPGARRNATQNVDAFNAAESKRKRGVAVDNVLRALEATHAALRDTLEAAPLEVFGEDYPWQKALHDDTHLHYAEHAADIQRWLR